MAFDPAKDRVTIAVPVTYSQALGVARTSRPTATTR